MGLFPFFTDEESDGLNLEDEDLLEEEDAGEVEPYREYEIDPETKRFTGRILEGTEAILTWIIFTLKSKRYEHEIYSWEYGEEFSEMIGNSYEPDLLQSEAKRMVEEALLVNEHITAINNFEAEQIKDKLHISFSVETDQGDTDSESEVDIYV